MKTRTLQIAVVLLLASPLVAGAQAVKITPKSKGAPVSEPFVESGPADIGTYIRAGRTPKYIRVNVRGYNVRTSPDFEVSRTSNIDFKSSSGSLFVVQSTRRMKAGVAVEIYKDGGSRWIYVPYARKSDFQFCESEACFSDMAESLDLLMKDTHVSVAQARSCGVKVGLDGITLPDAEPVVVDDPKPVARTKPRYTPVQLVNLDGRIPARARPARTSNLEVAPYWEVTRGPQGQMWTQAFQNALDTWGSSLLNARSLGDQNVFCPRFSSLSTSERREFWIHLFAAMGVPESGEQAKPQSFDETNHQDYSYGTLGDHGLLHYSMGLLMLTYKYGMASMFPSYHAFCRGIDASRDRGKNIADPSLTIYDVTNQANCSVGIMNAYVEKHGAIGFNGAPAWSTITRGNPDTRRRTLPALRRFTPCFKASSQSTLADSY
jgi:hypothetical protein